MSRFRTATQGRRLWVAVLSAAMLIAVAPLSASAFGFGVIDLEAFDFDGNLLPAGDYLNAGTFEVDEPADLGEQLVPLSAFSLSLDGLTWDLDDYLAFADGAFNDKVLQGLDVIIIETFGETEPDHGIALIMLPEPVSPPISGLTQDINWAVLKKGAQKYKKAIVGAGIYRLREGVERVIPEPTSAALFALGTAVIGMTALRRVRLPE